MKVLTAPISEVTHLRRLQRNLRDVIRLLEVHSLVSNRVAGRASALQMLNRSAVVLLTACWEAFIEDLATVAFDSLLAHCRVAESFPRKVRARATRAIKDNKDELAIWSLAGDGWKSVLTQHRDETIRLSVGMLNSPSPDRIDELYFSLIGLNDLSANWRWPGVSASSARAKLEQLLLTRGRIAHGARNSSSVTRPEIDRFVGLTHRLAVQSHNAVVDYLTAVSPTSAWSKVYYSRFDIGSPASRRSRIKRSWTKRPTKRVNN